LPTTESRSPVISGYDWSEGNDVSAIAQIG
jgi:hypothetical protein